MPRRLGLPGRVDGRGVAGADVGAFRKPERTSHGGAHGCADGFADVVAMRRRLLLPGRRRRGRVRPGNLLPSRFSGAAAVPGVWNIVMYLFPFTDGGT